MSRLYGSIADQKGPFLPQNASIPAPNPPNRQKSNSPPHKTLLLTLLLSLLIISSIFVIGTNASLTESVDYTLPMTDDGYLTFLAKFATVTDTNFVTFSILLPSFISAESTSTIPANFIKSCHTSSVSTGYDVENDVTATFGSLNIAPQGLDTTLITNALIWTEEIPIIAPDMEFSCKYYTPYNSILRVRFPSDAQIFFSSSSHPTTYLNRIFPMGGYYEGDKTQPVITIGGLESVSDDVLDIDNTIISTNWDSPTSTLTFPDGLPNYTSAIKCTGAVAASITRINVALRLVERVSAIELNSIFPTATIALFPNRSTTPQNNLYLSSIILNSSPITALAAQGLSTTHKVIEYTYKVTLRNSDQNFLIEPPRPFSRQLIIPLCSVTAPLGINHEWTTSPSARGGKISFAPVIAEVTVLCLAIPSAMFFSTPSGLQNPSKSRWDHVQPSVEMQYGPVERTSPWNWLFSEVSQNNPIPEKNQISSPSFVSIQSFQYGLSPLSSGGFHISAGIGGSYQYELPNMRISADINVDSITNSHSKYLLWYGNSGPTTGFVSTSTFSFTTDVRQGAIDIIPYRVHGSDVIVDPEYNFNLNLVPDVVPTKVGDDYRYSAFPTSSPLLTVQSEYMSLQNTQIQIDLPPVYMPDVTFDASGYQDNFNIPKGETFSCFTNYIILSTPKYYPESTISPPSNSVWVRYPKMIINPYTTIVMTAVVRGAKWVDDVNEHSASTNIILWGPVSIFLSSDRTTMTFQWDTTTTIDTIIEEHGFSMNQIIDTTVAGVFVEVTNSMTITKFSRPPVTVMEPTKSYFGFQLTNQQYGTSTISIIRSGGVSMGLPRLIDNNNEQMTPTPVVNFGETIQFTFTTTQFGFPVQRIELFYFDSDGRDVKIKDIGSIDSTQTVNNNSIKIIMKELPVTRKAFFRLTYPYDPTGALSKVLVRDTVYFDLIPACMVQDSATASGFKTNCAAGETCIHLTGKCVIIDTNPTLPTIPDLCPKCNVDNTESCVAPTTPNGTAKCTCKSGWVGPYCLQSTSCDPKKSKCNPGNGYVLPLPNSSQCESTCNCYNQWAGLSCQSCQLQCLNDGIAYNDCARCGCREGFQGQLCECSAVTGSIILNAYNPLITKTSGRLSTSNANDDLFKIDSSHLVANYHYPVGSTEDDVGLVELFKEIFVAFQIPLTSKPDGKFTPSINPLHTSASTKFIFNISYNCADNNPSLTSFDQLQELWNNFVKSLKKNQVIVDNFIFPADDQTEIIEDLEPTPPSLPPDGESLVNGGEKGQFIANSLMIVCALMILQLW